MLLISALGTHLPSWDCDVRRTTGSGAGAITFTVDAGRTTQPRARTSSDAVELDGGRPDLRRVAMRSGVPDYGDAVQPESEAA
jgi:hypothetical protein